MKPIRRRAKLGHLFAAVVVLGMGLCSGSVGHGARFEAGLAVLDITPPVGWRRAGGYGERISTARMAVSELEAYE